MDNTTPESVLEVERLRLELAKAEERMKRDLYLSYKNLTRSDTMKELAKRFRTSRTTLYKVIDREEGKERFLLTSL